MYPLKLIPAVKDYLWGGTKIRDEFGIPGPEILAEAWMLSVNPAGESIVANGPLHGKTLRSVLFGEVEEALGKKVPLSTYFPLLVKLIDAKQALSIQVHPSDPYAIEHEGGFGKTEMWYVLDAKEDSYLYCGFRKPMNTEELRASIEDNTITDALQKLPVRAGDVLFIEAGTVHAIGAGILIAEIQQNSNSTYRVYDFDRRDSNGNRRELHIDKALDVIRTDLGQDCLSHPVDELVAGGTRALLASCDYFNVERMTVTTEIVDHCDEASFHSLLFLSGTGRVLFDEARDVDDGEIEVKKGDSIFIPAGTGRYRVQGTCVYLKSSI